MFKMLRMRPNQLTMSGPFTHSKKERRKERQEGEGGGA